MNTKYDALDRALIFDKAGYVCTPATTLDTIVKEWKPVLGEDNKPKRDTDGKVLKELGPVVKKAKIAIGPWADAEAGEDATKARFLKQLKRIQQAALEYGLDQDENNLGVAIITSKSGIVVLDIDAGKVPEPNDPSQNMDAESAHDLLLGRLLKVAGISNADIDSWINHFRQLVHVRTPSGGWHYYFQRPSGRKPRMHTGIIKYVDIRAGFKNEAGEWESSSLAFAAGNVTSKGEYLVYKRDEFGQNIKQKTLPPVTELPVLPEALCDLFEKTTVQIHAQALLLGIPIPDKAGTHFSKKAPPNTNQKACGNNTDSKWRDLSRKFVEKAFERAQNERSCQ